MLRSECAESPCRSFSPLCVMEGRRFQELCPKGLVRVYEIHDWRARTPSSMLSSVSSMMKRETFSVADIYVPIKRRITIEQRRVDEIAASMLDSGQQTPILVRADGTRFVLVEGLHRLEAAKALGEKTIVGFRVDARKH